MKKCVKLAISNNKNSVAFFASVHGSTHLSDCHNKQALVI